MKRIHANSRDEKKIIRWSLVLVVFMVILDQLTKILVVAYIPFGSRIPVIPGIFNLTYITNRGAAWGILSGKGWLLFMISLAVLAAILVFLRPLAEGWPERYIGLFLIVSGIIGNSIDRIWRHEVVDFLDFYIMINNSDYHWPSFNVADSCITIGVGIFILSSLLRKQDGGRKPRMIKFN